MSWFVSRLCLPLLAICLVSPALAETDMDRCYKSDIDYADNPELTQAERLESMNAALFDSINRFEECMLSTNAANSAASSSSGSAGSGASGAEAGTITGDEASETEMESYSGVDSAAASEMSGTEAEPMDATELAAQLEQMEQMENQASDGETVALNPPPGSGRAPEDIPPAANDDAVAAQIRLAAEVETDPDKKAKLWNEYRKYKGIPVKEDE